METKEVTSLKFVKDKAEELISGKITEPTSYTGRNFIELKFNSQDEKEENNSIFNKETIMKINNARSKRKKAMRVVTKDMIETVMKHGFYDRELFPLVGAFASVIRLGKNKEDKDEIISNLPLSEELRRLTSQDVFNAMLAGKSLMIYRSSFGSLDYQFVGGESSGDAFSIVSGGNVAGAAKVVGRYITIDSPVQGSTFLGPPGNVVVEANGRVLDEIIPSRVQVQIGNNPLREVPLIPGPDSTFTWSSSDTITEEGVQTILARLIYKAGQAGEDRTEDLTMQINVRFATIPPIPTKLRPRLLMIEKYRLSSFAGKYGFGRVIKTFSLLPGEKTKISVKTYTKTTEEAKRSSSISDSITQESSRDFENSVATEQSDKRGYEQTFSYEVNAEAEATWGWGSASVSGGVRGSTNSTREQFAKNATNAVQKHMMKSSSTRNVQINTSYEKKVETGEETSIEREIQNINVGHTLNFVFRQMNQEFVSLLHLIDIRIAYWDGNPDPVTSTRRELSLPELDSLDEVIQDSGKVEEIKKIIKEQIYIDYSGQQVPPDFIEEIPLLDSQGNIVRKYLRLNPKYFTTNLAEYPYDGDVFRVPGIILSANKNVMRTEGVFVDALLGEEPALDEYSVGLQNEDIRRRGLENNLKETEVRKNELGINIVDDGNETKVKRWQRVFPCCKPQIFSLWPPKDKEDEDEKDEEDEEVT